MSTAILTIIITIALVASMLLAAGVALYRRQVPAAALATAAAYAAAHLSFVAAAWEAAAKYDGGASYPAAASLPTAVYDAPAWAAVALVAAGVIGASVRAVRRRRHEGGAQTPPSGGVW